MFTWIDNLKQIFSGTDHDLPDHHHQTNDDENEPYDDDSPDLLNEYFSTHLAMSKAKRQSIIDNAFQLTPEDFQTIDFALDQVDNQQPGKSAFRIGRQIIPDKLFAWYVSQSFIGYQACSFVAQHWLVDRACSMKGRDAVRKGFKICFDDGIDVEPETIQKIERLNKKFELKKRLEQADKFKNVYGIYHILFRVESPDPEYYEKPFNPDGITPGSYKGMTGIDPYWISPFLSTESVYNPDSLDFYEPNYWYISGKKYHHSHFVILRGPEVSDILKPSYLYGGIPLTQRILERVYAAERTANEAPQLTMTKRLVIRYIDNLQKLLARPDKFEEAMEALAEFRDNYGIFVDSINNKVEQQDTSLSDLDAVIMNQYQIVAMIVAAPATKLLETSPKGFQSTGEFEIQNYHEELESIQENDLQPIVDKHHECLMRSHIAHTLPDREPITIDITWNPLAVLSEKEIAEIAELRARTDRLEQDTGAIDAYDIRDRLITDELSGYSGIEDLDRPEELTELPEDPDPAEELPASGNLDEEKTDDESDQGQKQTPTITKDFAGYSQDGWYVFDKEGKKQSKRYRTKRQALNQLKRVQFRHDNGGE